MAVNSLPLVRSGERPHHAQEEMLRPIHVRALLPSPMPDLHHGRTYAAAPRDRTGASLPPLPSRNATRKEMFAKLPGGEARSPSPHESRLAYLDPRLLSPDRCSARTT